LSTQSGAIAAAVHGCGIDSKTILEATISISDTCSVLGGARGRLLPLLREQLYANVGVEEFESLRQREGSIGIAYREIFPQSRPILQIDFEDRADLINAVCFSSMFPFFATNWPCALDTYQRTVPRLVVNGFFTVARDRFGCPDFQQADGVQVDRTVTISVFPQQVIGLNASQLQDCISPTVEDGDQLQRLFRLATESSSRKDLTAVYESGWADAERWCNVDASQEIVHLN
jgi:hypothetical protein